VGLIGATMNRAVPWNGGVGNLDLREAARRAAKREGLSVGEWLDAIIAERAEMLGIDLAKLDAEERVYAVTERLARAAKEFRLQSEPASSAGDPQEAVAAPTQSRLTHEPERIETLPSLESAAVDTMTRPQDVDQFRTAEAKLTSVFRARDQKPVTHESAAPGSLAKEPMPTRAPFDIRAKLTPPPADLPRGPKNGDPTALQALLDRAAAGRAPGETGKRIAMPSALEAVAAPPLTETALNEIKALLDRFRPEQTLDKVERRLEALAVKIDAALADRRSSAPVLDLGPVEQMIGGLVGKVDTMRQNAVDVRALETMVRRLSDKLDQARDPQANAHVFNALQEQVGKLAERIDRSDAGLTAIVSVERSLGELFSQLEETRDAAINAAEGAARTAARDTLRAALMQSALPFNRGPGGEAAAGQVSQEISSLRALREASDKRLDAMMTTLNQSLEQVVSRLASMEQDRPAAENQAIAVDQAPAETLKVEQDQQAPVATLASRQVEREAPTLSKLKASDIRADPLPFIAAARRAAQDSRGRNATATRSEGDGRDPARNLTLAGRVKTYLAANHRPLLLSLAGLVLLLGAVQVVRLRLTRPDGAASTAPAAPARSGEAESAPLAPPSHVFAANTVGPVTTAPAAPLVAPPAIEPAPVVPAGLLPVGADLHALAAAGNSAAQFEVGLRFVEGRDGTRDARSAADWFEKAARQGLAPAAYRLGSLYEKGLGVARDPAAALQWYREAAEAGNVRAMHNLAVMAAEGARGKPDYATAAAWFGRASQMGVRDSQVNLAILYARGLGIPQNLTQSYLWFAIAAAQGDEDATKKRDEVATKLDARTIASAQVAAAGFRPAPVLTSANEVPVPPGGWDAETPAHTSATSTNAHVSSIEGQ
jgi:TPR repeat protein